VQFNRMKHCETQRHYNRKRRKSLALFLDRPPTAQEFAEQHRIATVNAQRLDAAWPRVSEMIAYDP